MSINDILNLLANNRIFVLIYLVALPLFALSLRLMHGKYKARRSPWKYFYSSLVYLTCIPGIFSLVVTLYLFIFIKVNLLTLDIYVYYLPVLSMAVTLAVIRKSIEFEQIPGFGKIYGLIILFVITAIIIIIMERLRVFVFFGGSVFTLFIAAVIVFMLLKYSIGLILGRKK